MARKDPHQQRMYSLFTDQHGRKWGAVTENATRHPTGPIEPKFTAPYMPGTQYLVFHNHDGATVTIDYDAAIADLKRAHAAYDELLQQYAMGHDPEKFASLIANPPVAMLRYAGQRPGPIELPDACKRGNKWALGLVPSHPMPEWAEKLMPSTLVEEPVYAEPVYDDPTPKKKQAA